MKDSLLTLWRSYRLPVFCFLAGVLVGVFLIPCGGDNGPGLRAAKDAERRAIKRGDSLEIARSRHYEDYVGDSLRAAAHDDSAHTLAARAAALTRLTHPVRHAPTSPPAP